MKKITILLSIATLVLYLTSCGGSEAIKEFEKGLNLMKKFTESVTKAAEDNIIDDSEADKINNILKDFSTLGKEEKKFDEAQEKEIKEYQEKNKAEIEKVSEEYSAALMAMYMCEGADKIKFE